MSTAAGMVRAHAKINLVLRVLARESTGYHQIETLFQRIALADEVTIRPTTGARSLDVAWYGAPSVDIGTAEHNLAWRAASAYAHATGWPAGWAIELAKTIPAGAGLGGGSSDAAAVLRALNAQAARPMAPAQLLAIGATLGADVAFFVLDTSLALGRGYGEKLEALPPLPAAPVKLFVPPYGIDTAGAYAALDHDRRAVPPRAPLATTDATSWAAVSTVQENDFEFVVFPEHLELGAVRDRFSDDGAVVARLSGSGSVVFGIWPNGLPRKSSTPTDRIILTATA